MNHCTHCGNETLNPKFCSKSCSVSHNNSIKSKRTGCAPKHCMCLNCLLPIETGKFCSQSCFSTYHTLEMVKGIELSGIVTSDYKAKKYLEYKFGHYCSICRIQTWMGKPLMLILDHIDGNSDNCGIDNIRLICSNCDSQLPTYKGRNLGSGRHNRRERYKNNQSY